MRPPPLHPARRPSAGRSALPSARHRGSVLIVALIMAAIIAIALTSYLRIATTSMRLADRSFYMNSAANLAELGLEEALYCYNQLDNVGSPASAWGASWTITGNTVTANLSGFALGPGAAGNVKIYCSQFNPPLGTTPLVVAKSTVTFARGEAPLEKYMEVSLRRRSLFANGVVAKNGITWNGHPSLDSWNSDPDNNPATNLPYSAGVSAANATIASANGNINLGAGGNVYGYAKTGPGGTTTNGSVHGMGTTTHDPSRVTTDFTASFPAVSIPNPTTVNFVTGTVPSAYPKAGDLPNTADGVYYYSFVSGKKIDSNTTVGATSGTYMNKKVVFLMNNHQGQDAFKFTGNKAITIHTGSTLTVYTNGDITATGNGFINGTTAGANPSSSLLIYGTTVSPSTQQIKVGGNGNLYAAIYAPEADLEVKGGGSSGSMAGSVIGKTVTFTGGADFHYDEALAKLTAGNPFGIGTWRELQSAAERATYATQLAF
jgi:hypothetical protein